MRKSAFCIYENKGADQLISVFVFATLIEKSLVFLNPKFQASSHLLQPYSPVCVGYPMDRFSHDAAQLFKLQGDETMCQPNLIGYEYLLLVIV